MLYEHWKKKKKVMHILFNLDYNNVSYTIHSHIARMTQQILTDLEYET